MLLMMFLFQKWFGSSFPEDVWAWWLLMHWLQLQFTPCEALPRELESNVLVHIFLPNFFLPVNFAFNMLWYSTPWTAPTLSNDPLWLTLFVECVNDRLLDRYQVFPIIVVSKNKRYPSFIRGVTIHRYGSLYRYNVWRYDASIPRVKYRYLSYKKAPLFWHCPHLHIMSVYASPINACILVQIFQNDRFFVSGLDIRTARRHKVSI